MAATTIILALAVCVLAIASIESAVIKMQEIPLKPGVTMKIVIKDDPKHEGGVVASIRIGMDDKPKTERVLTKLINSYVKPASDFVPDFEDRNSFGKGNGNCGSGQVRRGPLCVNA
ncbi:uncharacterized protein LOC112046234 [Bicyclus anynana]|uniref:Uncharacterized protein LOC112046234 n=1 Tax=Bicyclus anynana TaxID=110368 RepID=A0A6J1N6H9_BICAN|nr:uncharacterized protein LOC112046234 [Bicyclus anynana]